MHNAETKTGAGPVTLSVDFSYIGTILTHAKAIHGITVDTECVRLALRSLGLIGKGKERDRRPSGEELADLLDLFDKKPTIIPMGRIVRFAVATAMRQKEIYSITWKDVDLQKRIVSIRDRKNPRSKANHALTIKPDHSTGARQVIQLFHE